MHYWQRCCQGAGARAPAAQISGRSVSAERQQQDAPSRLSGFRQQPHTFSGGHCAGFTSGSAPAAHAHRLRTVANGILDSHRQMKRDNENAPDKATDSAASGQATGSIGDEGGCSVECVTQIYSQSDFERELQNAAPQTLIVVDFYKTACGSCRYIQPGFAKLCRNSGDHHAAVIFLKHNIIDEYDEGTELAKGLKIKSVPQFDFYLGGNLVERFATRDKARVADAINKHAGEGTVVLSEIDRNPGLPTKVTSV